jgi:hypothetical protein
MFRHSREGSNPFFQVLLGSHLRGSDEKDVKFDIYDAINPEFPNALIP